MRRAALALLLALAAMLPAPRADAGCGCDKPPPPHAAVRPFVAVPDARITLFDARLVAGRPYRVQFVARADGSADWSRGLAVVARDPADGALRVQLPVAVAPVALGPCRLDVYDDTTLVYSLPDDAFTVAAAAVPLSDLRETVVRDGYRAAIGSDGTMYVPVHVGRVSEATTFTGAANGFPLRFTPENVVMYNLQGFLMQLLDPSVPGLFQIDAGAALASDPDAAPANLPEEFAPALLGAPDADATSDLLSYWRHEFRTYKQQHRRLDAFRTGDDAAWHADGTYHVDHDTIVVAIRGTFDDGTAPAPGATPPFRLVITSSQAALR
jgi:hypothetical protein